MPSIHATAIVSSEVELADDVEIGPYAILQGKVTLGSGCSVGPHVVMYGNLTVGVNNQFHAGVIVGDVPQHSGYDKKIKTGTVIGDHNIFREGVTVHRGMHNTARPTTIGSRNLFMVNAHIAHDCILGDDIVMANGALLGGHAEIADRVFLSGNSAVHQFCRVGRMAMVGGTSCISQDLPPFWIVQGRINELHGVNIVGMRRGFMTRDDITAMRQAYRVFTRQRLPIPDGLKLIETEFPESPAVKEFCDFVRKTKRGICSRHQGSKSVDSADDKTD